MCQTRLASHKSVPSLMPSPSGGDYTALLLGGRYLKCDAQTETGIILSFLKCYSSTRPLCQIEFDDAQKTSFPQGNIAAKVHWSPMLKINVYSKASACSIFSLRFFTFSLLKSSLTECNLHNIVIHSLQNTTTNSY